MRTKERGAALVEYALLVSLLAVICIGSVRSMGNAASDSFQPVCSVLGATRNAAGGCEASTGPNLGD